MHQLRSLRLSPGNPHVIIDNLSISYETISTSYDTVCNYSKNGYRYGFNGMEKVNEIAGDGNDYDFGARIYDGRLGRWFSCDPKIANYPSWSPYHFGYCNPIIVIDPNGEENIVVVGGIDYRGDAAKFVNCGLKQLREYANKDPKERTTFVLMTANMSLYQIIWVKLVVSAYRMVYNNIHIETISSASELTNYLNSKSTSKSGLSGDRTKDKITDMAFFGHGYKGSFEGGHGADDAQRKIFSWGIAEARKLNKGAFDNVKTIFYSCNAASDITYQGEVTNLVNEVSTATGGTATGWEGQTTYSRIYNESNEPSTTWWEKIVYDSQDDEVFDKYVREANNYPSGGDDEKPDKVTYSSGKETKREKTP